MSLQRRDFEITDEMFTVAVWACMFFIPSKADGCTDAAWFLAVGPSVAALVANTLVLAFAVAVYLNRKTRRLLSRQSLVMLLSVQAFGLVYDAAYMCVVFVATPRRDAEDRLQRGSHADGTEPVVCGISGHRVPRRLAGWYYADPHSLTS
jgi:hypothetical protein